ncbi:uncharacterized protein L969DRAFT_73058 [Mixia osmundae IAM 14324]|uniref:BPL/LPL catalytic domain-containing protein n=1 Tax=Mixia osmundae (strain CBS 9802 / IAM 14324 / JCM 22182 / KY 12970) TaxID=764103 RepID=G7E9D4_MIXOS|nr:uncharacterized protein L969DRAFT_73058 [Mixia osmundae IAM 14324]KEI39883.1 hypothetical protein L969DRAFT_73058 [Mixia osmundae IAM 14324]GAA99253.1 hypothetical protein E5Q_05947 [Mixia osmundae IAM 14324]
MNVLIYNDAGVSEASVKGIARCLKILLATTHDVLTVNAHTIANDPWQASTSLLVIPGGRDLPFTQRLNGKANACIRQWVEAGGSYLGICAGAYFASAHVDFEAGSALAVKGDRELSFFGGTCKGAAFPGFVYESESGARHVPVALNQVHWSRVWSDVPSQAEVYWNGGGTFQISESTSRATVLATYSELDNAPAAVLCHVGKGKALLWSAHPEYATRTDMTDDRVAPLMLPTLLLLGIEVAEGTSTPAPPVYCVQHLMSNHMLGVVSITSDIQRAFGDETMLRDTTDVFRIVGSGEPNDFLPFVGHHGRPDYQCVRAWLQGSVPPLSVTPLFDFSAYFAALTRRRLSLLGRVVLYAETLSSTQTTLDKNPKWLKAMPSGLVSIASHQTAGRGRGGNAWISPAGCLQFSLVLRTGKRSAPRLVFLQYMVALAIVEGILDLPGCSDLPVRLKWPNDLYADMGVDAPVRYQKLGGILVNSSFADDDFTLIVGCGINVFNERPTTSISALLRKHNLSVAATITMPEVLAAILCKIEAKWDFYFSLWRPLEPFIQAYTQHWLHTDQIITLEETGQRLLIKSITQDYGLLHTEVMDGRERTPAAAFADLQPDGNSFDMLRNLVRRKT